MNYSSNFFELSQYFLEQMDSQLIWQLAEKGFLFSTHNLKTNEDFLIDFHLKVKEIIELRRDRLFKPIKKLSIDGKYLLYDPFTTMFDGLSETESSGFFDVNDVPPPEFWIGVENDKLISFIPFKFMGKAIAGVEHCLGGCLEWVEPT